MKVYGMWLPTGKLIDTDIDIPDIIITNPNCLYKLYKADGKPMEAAVKEMEITGLVLDLSPDSAQYDENGNLISK